MDPVLKYLAVGRQLGYAFYLTLDALTYFDQTGIYKLKSGARLQKEAYRAWFAGITCNIVAGVYTLYNLQQLAKKQKEARDKQNQRDLRKRKPVASVDWPWSRVVACEAIDDIRFLIGDEYGRLGLVQVDFRNVQTCLVLIPLGSVCGSHKVAPPSVADVNLQTSPPTTITHLSDSQVFIGSHCGD